MRHGTAPKIQPVLFLVLCAACFHLGTSQRCFPATMCTGNTTDRSTEPLIPTPGNVVDRVDWRVLVDPMNPGSRAATVGLLLRSDLAGINSVPLIVIEMDGNLTASSRSYAKSLARKKFGDPLDGRTVLILGVLALGRKRAIEYRFRLDLKFNKYMELTVARRIAVSDRKQPVNPWEDLSIHLTTAVPGLPKMKEMKSYVAAGNSGSIPMLCYIPVTVVCPAGTYVKGRECWQCPVNTFSDVLDAQSCTNCTPGTVSNDERTQCTEPGGEDTTPTEEEVVAEEGSDWTRIVWIIAAVVILIAAVVFVGCKLYKYKKEQREKEQLPRPHYNRMMYDSEAVED